jgi:hypothetical protein
MHINFSLTPLELVQPWGNPDNQSLHWFGLTDGQYWIDVGSDALFEYATAVQERFGFPRYCDYQVSRLHEDLLDMVPAILEPVPANLVAYLCGASRKPWDEVYRRWFEDGDGFADKAEFWRLSDAAHEWIDHRSLDSGYLSPSANITFWSDEANVYVGWDNSDSLVEGLHAWQALNGAYSVSRTVFESEVHSFHNRLMADMQIRIEQVRAGTLPTFVQLDIAELDRQQQQRGQGFSNAFSRCRPRTEWGHVADAIRRIEANV